MRLTTLIERLFKRTPHTAAALRAVVDDSSGWFSSPDGRPEFDAAAMQSKYASSLQAWRSNPIAWRIIAITTDFVLGERIHLSSPLPSLQRFLNAFWHHPQNRMDLRLEPLCDELSRAGDLFLVLFRNPQDGMSYLRVVTKDRILRIETAENDWERELAYVEQVGPGSERRWLSPLHPEAAQADAVMLHYAINRPAGALLGESDLASLLPWLSRYSRLLEDRVRLHWASRAFLWMVTVPTNSIHTKREQYRNPPESGSIIFKDHQEDWRAVSPDLKGFDAQFDLQAVRQMIDAGSGYPPHWRGEPGDANLATAQAMQGPTERHLLRRQQFFLFVLQDIVYQAHRRAVEIGMARPLRSERYSLLFEVRTPDLSREDNESLARAAQAMASALQVAGTGLGLGGPAFRRLALDLVTRFAGQPLNPEQADAILAESPALQDPAQIAAQAPLKGSSHATHCA
jgi:hypothetical protein